MSTISNFKWIETHGRFIFEFGLRSGHSRCGISKISLLKVSLTQRLMETTLVISSVAKKLDFLN